MQYDNIYEIKENNYFFKRECESNNKNFIENNMRKKVFLKK